MMIYENRIRSRDLSPGCLDKIARLLQEGSTGTHLVASGRRYIRVRIDRDPAGQLYVQRVLKKQKVVQEAIPVGVMV